MIKESFKFIPQFIKCPFLKLYFSYKGKIKFGKGAVININSHFEGYNYIGINTAFTDSYLGLASYIANHSIIRKTKIGKFCAIGDNVRTFLGLHPTKDFVSIHPVFFSIKNPVNFSFVKQQLFEEHKYIDANKKYVVEIANDVWIGTNVLIMDGIRIGDGAILAAGSVITKDVEPYTIVGGVPAKFIRKRFKDSEIDFLLNFKWWERNIEWITQNSRFFELICEFVEKFAVKYEN